MNKKYLHGMIILLTKYFTTKHIQNILRKSYSPPQPIKTIISIYTEAFNYFDYYSLANLQESMKAQSVAAESLQSRQDMISGNKCYAHDRPNVNDDNPECMSEWRMVRIVHC